MTSRGDQLVDFYTVDYSESDRLVRANNRLEFMRTQELLRRSLPPAPARVLDVGGGTGVYAAWMANDGYEVDLIDFVPEHVRQARALSTRLDRPFGARVGDARDLAVDDACVDACLLLGPLYHLPEPSDRALALSEAVRVTRPGGLVCAAAISRFAWPLYALRDGHALTEERLVSIAAAMATGLGDPVGALPMAVSHRPDELVAELAGAGLRDVGVVGIEGPGWTRFTPDLAEDGAEALLDAALSVARLCDDHPDIAAASAHLLAFGRRP